MVPCRVGSAPNRKLRDLRTDRELLWSRRLHYPVRAQGVRLIGAGTIINPIIKVVTTVVVLGAIYLFFLKPILDTTEEVTGQVGNQIRQSQSDASQRSQDIALTSSQSRADSYASSLLNTWPAGAREVKSCVREAKGNADAMERCAEFGQTLVHTLQSDRNFALSYADSLDLQGRSGDAATVRECVDRAGFKAGAMQRCRDLADKLLFG
jgi:hypothetical protein